MADASQTVAAVVDSPLQPVGCPDRAMIVTAALTLIDADGLHGWTMRKVAGQLGVPPTTLGKFFPLRDRLLDAVVDVVIDELYDDPTVQSDPVDWQEYLLHLAHGVRRVALAHPQVFPLIATRPPTAPWLQPPLRSLQLMEGFLEALQRFGFSDRRAVTAYRAFASFLLGHLLLEVSALGADIGPLDEKASEPRQAADLDGYPRLASLQQELSQQHTTDEFEEALESLLDRLETDGIR